MKPLEVGVVGIGAWSASHESWTALRSGLLGRRCEGRTTLATRPTPLLLPPAERRRVPDGVAVALEVAREALAMAGRTSASDHPAFDPSSMASVFASAHGDLAIVDYLCATLASDPTLLSPTRFHHSVHNAAAGYWSIATPSFGPSTALAAGDTSFALGLLEAATQVIAEGRPVLLVVFDTPAVGLIARTAPNTALFGSALLLAPIPMSGHAPRLSIAIREGSCEAPLPRRVELHALAGSSPAARALALLDGLAGAAADTVGFPMDAASILQVAVTPAHVHATTAESEDDRIGVE